MPNNYSELANAVKEIEKRNKLAESLIRNTDLDDKEELMDLSSKTLEKMTETYGVPETGNLQTYESKSIILDD
ncbi:MAG: hypothetical protein K9L56_15040 [Clostridiales bacterium]|nr:hypothetical protein [Clostridiales bacterium]